MNIFPLHCQIWGGAHQSQLRVGWGPTPHGDGPEMIIDYPGSF